MVVAVGWAEDNKNKVLLNTKHVAVIFLCLQCFCVILFQVTCYNPKNCENGEKVLAVKGLSGLLFSVTRLFITYL